MEHGGCKQIRIVEQQYDGWGSVFVLGRAKPSLGGQRKRAFEAQGGANDALQPRRTAQGARYRDGKDLALLQPGSDRRNEHRFSCAALPAERYDGAAGQNMGDGVIDKPIARSQVN